MCCTAAEAEGHLQLSPSVVDMLRISIFRNTAACRDELTATNTKTVTRAPSFSWAPVGCSMLGLGGSRGDGLVRSPADGQHDTAAPGSRGAADRQQGDAPQSAG